ncbi:MAG: hypothetical protein LC644_00230 [Pseudonocardia sp.]|nr:hypothetical protein [Pseudonocardia sp.]
MDDVSAWSRDLAVEIRGRDVINHAGTAALRLIGDRSGLTSGLPAGVGAARFLPVHDRGRVLADTALLIADGGRVLSTLATLRDQGELYGPVAWAPTLWRALDEIGLAQRAKIARVRAKTREHAWSLIEKRHGQIPPSTVADRDLGKAIGVRMDASLVIAHSDKELAAGTYQGSWGPSPVDVHALCYVPRARRLTVHIHIEEVRASDPIVLAPMSPSPSHPLLRSVASAAGPSRS